MSILSAAMVCAALIGADPEVITTEHTEEHTESAARPGQDVVPVDCREAGVAPCGTAVETCTTFATTCVTSAACQPGCVTQSGCFRERSCCLHRKCGCKSWCLFCDDDDECEDECDDDLCCWDRHLLNYCIGPGDLYPHYAYYPIYHGYYYFRPYNHEHVFKDSALAAEMGGEPRAPYSVEFLRTVFPPAPVEPIPEYVIPELPNLEALLLPPERIPYIEPN